MGAGRCGSTILNIILGSHPEIETVGEIKVWAKNRGLPRDCNEKIEDFVSIMFPHHRLLLTGCYQPTIIINREENVIQNLLIVGQNKVNIKQNARLSQVAIIDTTQS